MTVADPRPRVLYVTHRVPFPPDKGDRIRNYHLLRRLATRGRVSLAALADEPVSDDTRAELARLCERVEVVPVGRSSRLARAGLSALRGRSLSEGAFADPAVRRLVEGWHAADPLAAAVVSTSALAPYLRGRLAGVPAFVDVVDVDSQKWLDFAANARGPKRWLYRVEARRLRELEAGLPRWAAAVTLVSRAEADVYEGFAGRGTVMVATNGVDLDYFRPADAPQEKACVFVGALDYLPNVDAAVWFVTEVWPAVRAAHPDAEFRLVGRKPAKAIRDLAARPGVRVVGQVPDVRPYVASAAVAVAPMRLSRGLQNKVLEALAMGKAVVASPPALAALRAEPGRHLLAATTPAEWAAAVTDLLADPDRRDQLGRAGRRFVDDHHHWDRCLRPLTDRIFGGTDRPSIDHLTPAPEPLAARP